MNDVWQKIDGTTSYLGTPEGVVLRSHHAEGVALTFIPMSLIQLNNWLVALEQIKLRKPRVQP